MGRDTAFSLCDIPAAEKWEQGQSIKVSNTRNFLHRLTNMFELLRSKKAGSPHPTPLSASFLVIQGQIREGKEEPEVFKQGLSHIQSSEQKPLSFLGTCKLQKLTTGLREGK